MDQKVNLFIVGEQKSGTTTLHAILDEHPEVCMSVLKEPGYFCTDFHEEVDQYHGKNSIFPVRNEGQYSKIFQIKREEKILGEASSTYLYSKNAAENIHRYNPKAKIIIMLRNPKKYLPSLHAQYLKETSEDVESLEEALNLEESRRKGHQLPKRVKVPSLLYYRERIKYQENIERFLSRFPKEQVKVILFENFVNSTKNEVEEVLDFLGLDKSFELDVSARNEAKSPRMKGLYMFVHAPILKSMVASVLPVKYQVKLSNLIKKFFLTKQAPNKQHLPASANKICEEETEKIEESLREYGVKYDLIKLWNK